MSPEFSRSTPKYKNILAIVIIVLALGIVFSANAFKGPFEKKTLQVSLPSIGEFFKVNSTFSYTYKNNSQELEKIIKENLDGKDGLYSIYIEKLDGTGKSNPETYGLRESEVFPAASLYKVYLMAAVLKEYGEDLLETETVSTKKSHLVEVFQGVDFGYEDVPDDEIIEYTLDEALERVGRSSNNFAAIMLAEKVGWGNVQAMAGELGAQNTTIKSPISTTAYDVGRFFKLLYQKQVVSPEVSEQLTHYLKLNQINDRIPAGVPEDTEVVHKTGELSRVRHDAGIVYLDPEPDNPEASQSASFRKGYIIVLMSQDLKYEDEAVETMAKISRDVYQYFSNK